MKSLGGLVGVILFGLGVLQADAQSMKRRVSPPMYRPPIWWQSFPKENNASFVRGTAQSADKQLAIEKATAAARSDIATRIESEWLKLVRDIHVENPELPSPPPADPVAVLEGTRIAKQASLRTRKLWIAYVLLAYPTTLVDHAVLDRARGFTEWYSLVENTATLRALESAIQ